MAVIVGVLSTAMVSTAVGQHQDMAPALPPQFNQPMPLYTKALGTFTRPISSTSAIAQAYFAQGFWLRSAFPKSGAIRSFREAGRADPACAICYWGEAWSWGSYLNAPMS